MQRRLAAAGFPAAGSRSGEFCPATLTALHAFQHARGLPVVDRCDDECWKALVEATWKLGDRLVVLTSPNLRGDDVVELQSRLNRLGFDCGRVDGIFGPRSARALIDFQTNCGLPADGVCGANTVRMLDRVIGQTGSGPGVGAVRERERLRRDQGGLHEVRVVVGQFGGLSTITRIASREIRSQGAQVMSLDEPDALVQARAANQFGAQVFIGFEGVAHAPSRVTFYRVPTFESVGGRTLADCLTSELGRCGLEFDEPVGQRLSVLRETKMPAVLCSLGPVRTAVDAAADIGAAVARALHTWSRLWTLIS